MMTKLQSERLGRYKKRLSMYYEAEEAVLLSQEYSIGTRKLRRADLPAIRSAIKELEGQVEALEECAGKRRACRLLPRDI